MPRPLPFTFFSVCYSQIFFRSTFWSCGNVVKSLGSSRSVGNNSVLTLGQGCTWRTLSSRGPPASCMGPTYVIMVLPCVKIEIVTVPVFNFKPKFNKTRKKTFINENWVIGLREPVYASKLVKIKVKLPLVFRYSACHAAVWGVEV
jgi:hypothetical protein